MTTTTTTHTAPRRLGRSELLVTALGMGCWAIGGAMASGNQPLGYAGTDDDQSRAAIRQAADHGVTLFDTADSYGGGHSETLLGETLADRPDVLIATKFGNTFDESARQLTGRDVSPDYVRRAVAASLRRLRRTHVDLYQLHTPDVSSGQAQDLTSVLEDLVTAGDIRWWGVSTDDQRKAALFAEAPHCTALQIQLNVLDDNRDLLRFCADHDLGVLCRSPLAMGLLGGRYTAVTALPPDDIRGRQPEWLRWFTDGRPDPGYIERLDSVREVLTSDGRTLAQGALAWIWAHDDRAIPLPGFRNSGQVYDNVEALSFGPLTPKQYHAVQRTLNRTE